MEFGPTRCCDNGMLFSQHDCQKKDQTSGFITKDSGKREEFSTGMRRDTQDDKPRYDLVDWGMIKRWAELMQRGALKYGEHNWKKAGTAPELARFQASALRHMVQWFNGETDEDHAAACYFNIAGAEMVKEKLKVGTMCDSHCGPYCSGAENA